MLGWVHAEIIAVNYGESKLDIKLDNGDVFRGCVMGVPLGSREKKEGYVQVCVGSHVIAWKGYGGDWLVTHEVSQINKPNSKSHNNVLLSGLCNAIDALADGLIAGGESTCPLNSPLTNASDMASSANRAKNLASSTRNNRFGC